LRALCDQHGILLVADEVQTGAGRTGTFFAMEQMGVAADIVTLAKSMAGGFPISAVIGRAEVMDAPAPGGLGGTYAGSPVGCAAALAVLQVFEDEKLLARSRAVGERLTAGLKALAKLHAGIGDVRGLGAMVAMELVEDRVGKEPAPGEKPSKSIVVLLGLTILAIAPSLAVMMTSFTRMVVVLSLARNAVGLQSIPPNQVITGLAVFLSLFVMAPTVKQMNDHAWQPYLKGEITQSQALKAAEKPIKTFMLRNTRREELNLMFKLSDTKPPKDPKRTSLTTLIPAFVLSELKAAFIIGVVVLLPFLVIDLVVGSGLMSLGMMMLPPVFVSLPFKLLLFVMVDGWSLIAHALVANYR